MAKRIEPEKKTQSLRTRREGKPETFEKLTFDEFSYRFKRIGEVVAESRDDSNPPSLRARRNLFLMRRPNPYSPHHWAAWLVLEKEGVEGVDVQDKLARALVEVLPELADCVDPELAHDSPAMPSEAEGDPPMLAWDARAASYLEGLGEMGTKYASALREKAAERWREYLETGDEEPLWSWWNGLTEGEETIRFMAALATVLWHDRVQPNRCAYCGVEMVIGAHNSVPTAAARIPR